MARCKNGAVAHQLRTLFHVGTVGELTDGQLLERFATGGGETAELAFAALLERHGPMVIARLPEYPGRHAQLGRCLPGHLSRPGQKGSRTLGTRQFGPLAPSGRLSHRIVRTSGRGPPAPS